MWSAEPSAGQAFPLKEPKIVCMEARGNQYVLVEQRVAKSSKESQTFPILPEKQQ